MFNVRAFAAGALLVTLLVNQAAAQELGNSPYSRFGLGDEAPAGFLRNAGMSGLGVSSGTASQINYINPALLSLNRLVTFEIAASSQLKKLENSTSAQDDGNVGLRYLAFSFPVSKGWTTSIGLKPYSNVSYQILTEAPVIGDPLSTGRYLYQGSGGISEVYWANGVHFGKGFRAGVQASYLFGTLLNESVTQVLDSAGNAQGNLAVFSDSKTLKDISLKGGLAYRAKLSEKTHLNMGVTYQYFLDFKANQLRTISTDANSSAIDTLETTIQERRIEVPHPIQVGVSIERNSWMLGADFQTQDWSAFSAFGEEAGSLKRSYRVSLGGEITPDPNSISSYLSRVTYRAGVSYGKTPINLNGKHIDEKQASIGFTLPTGRGGSALSMAFIAGNRGTTEASLIKETFYRFELGLSLSDRWFQRRQVD